MIEEFCELFRFDPQRLFYVGVERERFIIGPSGMPIPSAETVLSMLPSDNRFGYELSAVQLEDRVGPIKIHDLRNNLKANDVAIKTVLDSLGLSDSFMEVAPEDMDLTVYNDPSGRYQQIVKNMPRHILLAACRVAGTHVHIGMPNMKIALAVYNEVIKECDSLCQIINHSKGERLEIYKEMAPDCIPRRYNTVEEFYEDAVRLGFSEDPRKNWQLIRVTVHGTIEFRMGGSTRSYDDIENFAQTCYDLCLKAYEQKASYSFPGSNDIWKHFRG